MRTMTLRTILPSLALSIATSALAADRPVAPSPARVAYATKLRSMSEPQLMASLVRQSALVGAVCGAKDSASFAFHRVDALVHFLTLPGRWLYGALSGAPHEGLREGFLAANREVTQIFQHAAPTPQCRAAHDKFVDIGHEVLVREETKVNPRTISSFIVKHADPVSGARADAASLQRFFTGSGQ